MIIDNNEIKEIGEGKDELIADHSFTARKVLDQPNADITMIRNNIVEQHN